VVKQLRRDSDHLPQSSDKVENYGAISHFPICLYGVVLN
jgi:hypothetical protein